MRSRVNLLWWDGYQNCKTHKKQHGIFKKVIVTYVILPNVKTAFSLTSGTGNESTSTVIILQIEIEMRLM